MKIICRMQLRIHDGEKDYTSYVLTDTIINL